MSEKSRVGSNIVFAVTLLVMIGFRIWLSMGIPMMTLYQPHDDLYFAKAAHYIMNGDWMGPYSQMTLIKAPFYSFFLAASAATGLSLFLVENLFYIGACLVLFFALKPVVKNRWLRLLAFTFLLYAPIGMATWWNLRVYREYVYLSLSLYVISFSIGLLLRLNQKTRKLLPWSIGLGLSMGAFLITREDGIWIMPVLLLLLLSCLAMIWLWKMDQKLIRSLLVILPIMLWYMPTVIVSSINYAHYGFWGVSDQLDSEFQRVMNTLGRIQVAGSKWSPEIQVTKAARMKAYEVSPLLNTMKNSIEEAVPFYIEGSTAGQKVKPDWYIQQYGIETNEIGNSHLPWMLRDVVASYGYYVNAKTAHEFYKQVADQLEAACNDGRLTCSPPKNIPLVGSIDQRQVPLIYRIAYEGAYYMLKSSYVKILSFDLSTWPMWPSNDNEYAYFQEFTNDSVDVRMFQASADPVEESVLNHLNLKLLPYKHKMMAKIAQIYKPFTYPLSIISLFFWIILTFVAFWKKHREQTLIVIGAIFVLGTFLSRLITLSIVYATTTISGLTYGTSIFLFALVFVVMMLSSSAEFVLEFFSSKVKGKQ